MSLSTQGTSKRALAICSLFASLACAEKVHESHFEFLVRVECGPAHPVASAELTEGGTHAGSSDDHGTIRMTAAGREGEHRVYVVRCPPGYRGPEKPLDVLLRRTSEPSRLAEYRVTCSPERRRVVVAVRAENGPSLPILYLGREVARTDSSGTAHVLIESEPEDGLELAFDTSRHPHLRPRNPSSRIETSRAEDIVVLDQKFVAAARPVARRARAQGPTRIH